MELMRESASSLEEKVYRTLEEKIITGEIKPGEAMTELKLSSMLGVSRTPVREALMKLGRDGLVELVPNKGAVVVGVSTEDLIDIYRIRMRLEGLAAAMAAERITDADKKKLSENTELTSFYMNRGDTDKVREMDTEFHLIIYGASGSRMIYRILSELHRNIKTYRRLSLSNGGRTEKSVSEHREILSAILSGDSAEADRLASLHVGNAMNNLLSMTGGIKNNGEK